MERARRQSRAVIELVMLLACFSCAFALDPSLDVSQYAHTAWKVRDGFAAGAIFSIAQTPDGYLWLGTELGLLRFDGVRAVPWEPPTGEHLPSRYISRLLVARDGTLWISTLKGLASWKDGKLTQYPEVAGHAVQELLQDHEGTVWFGVYEPGKSRLCAFRGGKIQCYGAASFGGWVIALYEDHRGNLWVSAGTGLWRWSPGPPERYAFPRAVTEANSLIEDDSGTLLLATNDGLKQLVGGNIQSYALPGVTGKCRPDWFFRSSDGSLWIGSEQGIFRLHQGRVDRFTTADGLSGDFITRIFEDREGNVWVGTLDGLDRFREFAVPTISLRQGLSNSAAWSVQATQDGSIWLGVTDGLNRWQNGRVSVYGRRREPGSGGPSEPGMHGISGTATEIANSGLEGVPRSVGQDDRGRLWVSTDGVFYFENGRFVRVPGIPGGNIYAIAGDGHGNVWILNGQAGLFQWTPDKGVQQIPLARLPKPGALVLLPDHLQGVWIGFFGGGLAYLKNGQVHASYNAADGLGNGMVSALRFGSRGALWAATEGGLSRIKDGHVATLTSKNGLPCDTVHWSMEDNDHAVWLYMPCGLVRINRSELDAWVSDPKRTIQATVFDRSDGVRTVGNYGGYGPHVTKSPDGKIWFLSRDGVSVIDPHHLPSNNLPPPVHIEQVTADRKAYDASKGLRLPPHVRDLEIDYTALSFVAPEKVRFRYKLEGLDSDWQDVGNRRQAFYTNLPPRHYRFRVMACNNSGVWNEEGASLDFAIAPAYYQTNWFRALCVVAFLALLWAAYLFRIRQLRRHEKKLRDVVETIPTIAWSALPDGWVDFSNHHWEEYTGLSLEKGSGSGWEAAVHPDDVKRHAEKWRASVASGQPFESEARYRRADGVYRWFLVRAVPLRDGEGKILKWYGTKSDIEDRKRAEQLQSDLAHINRVSMMGELAASLSHELKQPIAAAMTNANTGLRWLKRDQPDVEEAGEAFERIVKDNARAAEIIDRLRSLYKKSLPQRELLNVNEVVHAMVVLLRGEAHRYAVSIRTDLAAELPKIMADRVQLQQVLMNLMLNAIEAMKESGGVLTVKSELDQDSRVLISVGDTGVGLPPEKADQIFNAFFTTKRQGSGMGLAISRTIIESHGGRLWATANDGRGATFHFTLPTTADEAKATASGTNSVPLDQLQ